MNTPFPWNPSGFMPESVANLFTIPKERKAGIPPPPGPKSQIDLSKKLTGLRKIVNSAPAFNTPIATIEDSERTRKIAGRGNK